jgi:signal transduction histidine kinase
MRGTWQTTSSGPGPVVAAVAVIIAFIALGSGAAARVASGLLSVLVAIAVTMGVLVVASAVAVVLLVRRRSAQDVKATAQYAARMQAAEAARQQREVEDREYRIALAAASAPKVEVTNVLPDTAALLAAAWNAQPSYTAQQQSAPVVRRQVEQ